MNNSNHEIIKRVRKEYPAEYSLRLRFDSVRIELSTNSTELVALLRSYYRDFISDKSAVDIVITAHESNPLDLPFELAPKTPDPGKTKIKEEWIDLSDGRIVRKCLTGMVFLFGNGEHVAVGPCVENSNQVVNFINNRYIEWKLQRGCLLGHAAGVSIKDRGIALAGFSGAGKSTLALHLLSKGADFISNDRLLIQQSSDRLLMHGVAKLPRINPGTILNNEHLKNIIPEDQRKNYELLSEDQLWNLEQKYDVFIDEIFGEKRFDLSGSMDGLVMLNWKRNDNPMEKSIVRIDERDDLLPAFMKSTGLFYLPNDSIDPVDRSVSSYKQILKKCTVFEFSGGIDFQNATDECMNFLMSI